VPAGVNGAIRYLIEWATSADGKRIQSAEGIGRFRSSVERCFARLVAIADCKSKIRIPKGRGRGLSVLSMPCRRRGKRQTAFLQSVQVTSASVQ
jgi:hypothetical protein